MDWIPTVRANHGGSVVVEKGGYWNAECLCYINALVNGGNSLSVDDARYVNGSNANHPRKLCSAYLLLFKNVSQSQFHIAKLYKKIEKASERFWDLIEKYYICLRNYTISLIKEVNMTKEEIWKPVTGYEGVYEISSFGRLHRIGTDRYTYGNLGPNGYYYSNLYKEGCTYHKNARVHRLVADAFIPNPKGLPFVNHKDQNRGNNTVENLEWCNQQYNGNYGNVAELISLNSRRNRPVAVYENGNLVATYRNINEAAEGLGYTRSTILRCCQGKQKTLGGKMVVRYNDHKDRWTTGLPMDRAWEEIPKHQHYSSERSRKIERNFFARGYFTAIREFYEKISKAGELPEDMKKVINENYGELLD